MKANEAPEKIYISSNTFNISEYATKVLTTKYRDNIEYTRTDAFIEKVCSWLENNLQGIVGGSIYIEDFRKYMEGE